MVYSDLRNTWRKISRTGVIMLTDVNEMYVVYMEIGLDAKARNN